MSIISINCATDGLFGQIFCIGVAILDDNYDLKETVCLRLKDNEITDEYTVKNIVPLIKDVKLAKNNFYLIKRTRLFLVNVVRKYFKDNKTIKILITTNSCLFRSDKQQLYIREVNILNFYNTLFNNPPISINKNSILIDVLTLFLIEGKKNMSVSEYIKSKGYFPNGQINHPLGDAINAAIAYSIINK